jgi:ATP-dependent helicase/nuclease subunit B
MTQPYFPDKLVEVGIISFKNLKAGFMPFQIKEGRELVSDVVDDSVLNDFKTELIVLLNEILNVDLPFEEKII